MKACSFQCEFHSHTTSLYLMVRENIILGSMLTQEEVFELKRAYHGIRSFLLFPSINIS